ncbi:carbohydrate ABC transporter permease [Rhodovibrionaceae bacterium A322]
MTKTQANLYGWLLLFPAAVLLVGFTHYPAVATFVSSFYSQGTVIRPSKFIGLDNYQYLIEDPVFWEAAINNLWFAIGTVPTSMGLALIMAIWVNGKIAGKGFLRLAYFTPTVLPMVAAANIWLFFYTPEIGLLDQALGLFGIGSTNWLGERATVLPALMAMTIWKEAGFFMIFYLAALQSLPPELKEAAALEGTPAWTYFRRVTFPLLMPTTLFILVNALLNAFKLVDHLFILTKGGPNNASNLLLYYIYESAFSFLDANYAATLTVVLLSLLALLALVQFLLIDKKVHYQ